MNSSAARDSCAPTAAATSTFIPTTGKSFPFPDVPLAQQQPIIALVDQILPCGEEIRMQIISALETELDAKINSLYGITNEPFLSRHRPKAP